MARKLTNAERIMIEKLAKLPDSEIDTTDIPEAPRKNCELTRSNCKIGDFHKH